MDEQSDKGDSINSSNTSPIQNVQQQSIQEQPKNNGKKRKVPQNVEQQQFFAKKICGNVVQTTFITDDENKLSSKTLSNAERQKRFREKKKLQSSNQDSIANKTANAERQRRFRAKKSQFISNTQSQSPISNTQCQNTISNTQSQEHIINRSNRKAYEEFEKKFKNNHFGHPCMVCNRLWFKNDLHYASDIHKETLQIIITNFSSDIQILVCSTCKSALDKKKIPTMATYNGFQYHPIPTHLPKLDLISERLISPRLPFMQIRRLRHVNGQYGIYGQVINVPVSVSTMVNQLPRDIDDDHCFYVHIKKKLIHKSSYLQGLINKQTIKAWLQYLVKSPLYNYYNITVRQEFLQDMDEVREQPLIDDVSEEITIEESLTAQQHTLLWNADKYLTIAPAEHSVPTSLLFDEHAEELSFPAVYLGQFRNFREGITVTPFMMATSELRRADRRGVTPYHLLYVAMKIMRLRVRDSLSVAFKFVGKNTNITRQQIESEDYIHNCIESNLAFLRCIPNSVWYWADRKKDLFAIIRQKGKPTAFMTLSANEIGWTDLLQLLYKLKNNGLEISKETAADLQFIEKSTLINEDAVTCAIYFNKLVNVLMSILQAKKFSPFGKYRVIDYFKRIEFQHRGSPHAHILLWLDNAPNDVLGENYHDAIELINTLISISPAKASGHIKLQTHKHTFTCYKKIAPNQKCRFEAPFMPCRNTMILTPMKTTVDDVSDEDFKRYKLHYNLIRTNLENNDYSNMDDYYAKNEITSDEHYINILRAGINRVKVFLKRRPCEKWFNPFNPFVLSILRSNTDFQIITEEYSCAAYVVEYVNKTNRGISNLQRKIIETMNKHPEFDIVQITRKMSVDILNSVEITSQEAAWYLLREPMSKSTIKVVYIPTIWPIERQRVKKTQQQLSELDEDSTNIWKENWFDKYEQRPEELEDVTLAQFVSKYYKNNRGNFVIREVPHIIRYRNYDIAEDLNEYKREMVTLHMPFRNEENEILEEMKFINVYDENTDLILNRRKEFESNVDIEKMIEICRQLCRENDEPDDEQEVRDMAHRFPEPNPFESIYNNPDAELNMDLRLASLSKLGSIAKKRDNIMEHAQFCTLMRSANEKQKSLLQHIISHLLSDTSSPLQLFFTGPADCGKTFVIKLIMEIYNRYTNTDGYCNAYIACASTGKAAVAIDGTTVHTALKISLSKLLPLSNEVATQYRTLFKYVKVLIIDEISMLGAELLTQIDSRLKQITGNFQTNFGGLDIILIGDLRQLPPVRATPIYKQQKQRMVGPTLWRDLKFYELTEVMRQSNQMFSSLLTKIGNGQMLNQDELNLITSRFFTKEQADQLCPDGIRLFYSNQAVTEYNNSILQRANDKINSITTDVFIGCASREQEAFLRQKLYKMPIIDTGGLPYEIVFVLNKFYIITTNIDVVDGLANGAVGKLVYLEKNNENEITRVWMHFQDSPKTGNKKRTRAAAYITKYNIHPQAVPIDRRTATIYLNNNKTIIAKRNHFPLVSACAMTIHKSQGGTFSEIVYEYERSHPQQLLYVALSRVTKIEGLFITTKNDDFTFYHGKRNDTSLISLQNEFKRLSINRLLTIDQSIIEFFLNKKGISLFTINCQSLHAHCTDIIDVVSSRCNFLLLCETWLKNYETIIIPSFKCIVQLKRRDARAAGVAIYQNLNDNVNIVSSNMSLNMQNVAGFNVSVENDIGEICVVRCLSEQKKEIIIATIYISPNNSIQNIIKFIHSQLLRYTPEGSSLLGETYHQLPMILSGDFNVNFSSNRAQDLISFLRSKLQLNMINDPEQATTSHGTTIDAVFFLNEDLRTKERPKATSLHRKPSSAWRKERRRDPIQSEALDMSAARAAAHCGSGVAAAAAVAASHHSRPSVIVPTTAAPQQHGLHSPENAAEFLAGATTEDTAVTPTASVTPSAATRGQRTGIRTAGVASDPAIDEHFKRSLGLKDYAAVFNAASTDKETGLSVDDHFAKALGETWTRLQATSRSKDST